MGLAKAIPAFIYKSSLGDSSNNGLSSKYDRVLILADDGYVDVDLTCPPENLCKVVTRHLFGRDYMHVEPYAPTNSGFVGWMSGGCFVSSSDSRFCEISQYPLSLHDRQESLKDYEILSR